MPYTKTNWQSGDIISSERLNHAEEGIAQAQQTADTANARDSLADLTDVDITNPDNGASLRYNTSTGKWQDYTPSTFSWFNVQSASNPNQLSYGAKQLWNSWVEGSNNAAICVKDIANKGFIPLTRATKVDKTYTFVFGDYTYVGVNNNNPELVSTFTTQITNPTTDQVLKYDGTKWVNGSASASVENYLDVYDAQNLKLTKTVQELLQLIEDGKKLCVIVPNSKTTSDGRSISKGTYLFTEYKDLGNYNFIFSGVVFTESFTTEKPTYTGTGPILSQNYPIRISTPMHNNDVIMLKNSYPYYWYNTTVSLNKLSDIQLTSPTDGQVLTYDATNSEWVNNDVSGSVEYVNVYGTDGALTKNFDEIVALIESGKIPYIEVTTEYTKAKHDHSPAFTLQKGKHYLAGINIVGSTSYRRVFFSNYMFESSGSTSTLTFKQPINSIDGLIGITWGTSTSNGSVLTYSSALNQWSPKANTIDNLTNVTISSASSGDVLQYDGTKWVNATPSSSGDDAPVILTLEDYTDTEGTYGTANTTYLYADDYGIITYSRLSEAFDSREQIAFKATETVGSYYPSMSLRKSNGMAYFQADNIIYTAVEENDGKFIKQNTRTEFYYKMEGRTLTGPRAPEVIQAVELGLDVKLYCDFSKANNTSTTQQFLKIKKLKLDFSYKCYNEDKQCYDYIFQAHDHVPIEYTDPTKQMSFSILYHDNSEYGSYYGASF